MSALGIDPGIRGAIAHYDKGRVVDIVKIPTYAMVINKKTRNRIDMVELIDILMIKKMMGVEIVIMEAVGGRPQQSASGAFVFGYTVGAIFALCIQAKLPIVTVPAQLWKKVMQVPGKYVKNGKSNVVDKAFVGKVIARADELMPDHRDLWRGPKGGHDADKAEAALLAMYGERYQLHIPGRYMSKGEAEFNMVYKNAETGA